MKQKAKVRCSTLKPHYTKQKSAILLTQCIAEIVNKSIDAQAAERAGIGAWGIGVKVAWAATSTKGKK